MGILPSIFAAQTVMRKAREEERKRKERERPKGITFGRSSHMSSTTGNMEELHKEYRQCMEDLAKWFVEHRRQMRLKDMRPITEKHFGSGEELIKFYNYLESPEGGAEVGKILRMEAWKAGIAGPER